MSDSIRVGIVGATVTPGGSGWGANAHVPALRALPGYELKAVCTAHEDTARASAAEFGAELAFHDMETMAAHPDVDLIAVCVRVPLHRDLVMSGLRHGKEVFCEWPLGADLAEAQEMTACAEERGLRTIVGLQARSDPVFAYARDLIAAGELGEVVSANVSVMAGAVLVRGPGRIWQGTRSNGANTMTIAGGHGIDALCFLLGEFTEITARVATRIHEWTHADTGEPYPVDSPDVVSAAGVLASGAEVAFQVAAVPHRPSGTRIEIYGRDATLVVEGGSANIGPSTLYRAAGGMELKELTPPDRYRLAPPDTPAGPPTNVAQAYARFALARAAGEAFSPDFQHAVVRHRLIDAMERSAAEGRAIELD